jgi:WD40 repeat protein
LSVVAASPVAKFVAGGYDSGEIQVGDVKKQLSRVVRLSDGSPITCLAWSPDGTRLAAGNERGDLLTIDLRRR